MNNPGMMSRMGGMPQQRNPNSIGRARPSQRFGRIQMPTMESNDPSKYPTPYKVTNFAPQPVPVPPWYLTPPPWYNQPGNGAGSIMDPREPMWGGGGETDSGPPGMGFGPTGHGPAGLGFSDSNVDVGSPTGPTGDTGDAGTAGDSG